jgi:hypothetical protein
MLYFSVKEGIMGRPKKSAAQPPHQAHGAETAPKSVYDIIGYKAHSYKTLDVEVYKEQIRAMNFADLQEHALDNEIVPIDDREALTERLVKEFMKKTSPYAAAAQKRQAPMSLSDKKKAEDILSRGR